MKKEGAEAPSLYQMLNLCTNLGYIDPDALKPRGISVMLVKLLLNDL